MPEEKKSKAGFGYFDPNEMIRGYNMYMEKTAEFWRLCESMEEARKRYMDFFGITKHVSKKK